MVNSWDEVWRNVRKPTPIGRFSQTQVFKILEKMLSNMPEDFTVIDIGCGMGITLEFLRKMFPFSMGIDNSKEALKRCTEKGFDLCKDVYQMDARKILLDDNYFDIVFSWGMLEHFENFIPFVSEMCRISDKYVILVQPNVHSFYGKYITRITNLLHRGIKEYPYFIEDFIEAFQQHKFRLVSRQSTLLKEFEVLAFKGS